MFILGSYENSTNTTETLKKWKIHAMLINY